nr:DJ-1/PfpI family protein [Alcaligenes faecalis]
MSYKSPLIVGSLVFDDLDQIDLTGPFEVLSRLPGATHRLYARTAKPVRDIQGLWLMPDAALHDAPQLDILHVPGGPGQQSLMQDEIVLDWLRVQAAGARKIFSVCTGALLLGAAGLLRGRRATTHWNSLHLLPFFGADTVNERVVFDGNFVFAAGVTSGIDGALQIAADMYGDAIAQCIQLYMEYAPDPPFNSGTPKTAPAEVLAAARLASADLSERREAMARNIAEKLGIEIN